MSELAAFLNQGLQLAMQEATTRCGSRCVPGRAPSGIFDAFHDEQGREAHLNGPIAQALMERAPQLLAGAPAFERIEVLGAKT